MIYKGKHKYLIIGMVVALVLCGILPVMANTIQKQILVTTGISVYVDNMKLKPVDAKGQPVEAFAYEGTTYLPVRAIANAANMSVEWDEETNTVYLGKKNVVERSEQGEQLTAPEVYDLYVSRYPDVKVKEIELDDENNNLIYKIKGFVKERIFILHVDAYTGDILNEQKFVEKNNYKGFDETHLHKVEGLVQESLDAEGKGAYFDEWEIEYDDGRLTLEVGIDRLGRPDIEYKYNLGTGELIYKTEH